MNWETLDKIVVKVEKKSQISLDEEDHFYKMKDYLPLFGDPKKNGKGHKVQVIEGIKGVVVPCGGPMKIKRSRIAAVTREKIVSDSSFQLTDTQHDDVFEGISVDMFSIAGTGATLTDLLGPLGHSTSPLATSGQAASSSTSGSSAGPAGGQEAQLASMKRAASVHGLGSFVQDDDEAEEFDPTSTPTKTKKTKGPGGTATPKSAGKSSGGGGGGGKRGRPRRDIRTTAEQALAQFEDATSEAQNYFGDDWKSEKKWQDRFIKDMGEVRFVRKPGSPKLGCAAGQKHTRIRLVSKLRQNIALCQQHLATIRH